jgi:hypothetical protein
MRSIHARRRRTSARAGLTVVEIVVAMSVLVVAVSIFCQMLVSTARMRTMNRESLIAADGARVALERLRNVPFLEVWPRFNESPGDDPGAAGSAPGHRFAIEGLESVEGASAGMVGTYHFPTLVVQGTSGTSFGGGLVSGGGKASTSGSSGGSGATTTYQLREDLVDGTLGMPRDLNGDNKIDDKDHALDYFVLPVRVEIEWQSKTGVRRFSVVTQLTDFRREEEE